MTPFKKTGLFPGKLVVVDHQEFPLLKDRPALLDDVKINPRGDEDSLPIATVPGRNIPSRLDFPDPLARQGVDGERRAHRQAGNLEGPSHREAGIVGHGPEVDFTGASRR
jgi:hypothetical protein